MTRIAWTLEGCGGYLISYLEDEFWKSVMHKIDTSPGLIILSIETYESPTPYPR